MTMACLNMFKQSTYPKKKKKKKKKKNLHPL